MLASGTCSQQQQPAHAGMTLLCKLDFKDMQFTLYFLGEHLWVGTSVLGEHLRVGTSE